jgi:putative redox protein
MTDVSDRRAVRLEWDGAGMRFAARGVEPESPAVVIDGDGTAGPSPMLALLMAAAGCSGADVVSILEKMRVTLRSLTIDISGVRRKEHPRRYTEISFRFSLSGEDLNQEQAQRAVDLSLQKYCSVVQSLAPDITVRHEIELT